MESGDRWPPVYDAEDLAGVIEGLAQRPDLDAIFFEPDLSRAGPFCQGDVLAFQSGVPVIDRDGAANQIDTFEFWLAIGNTCDFARANEVVRWTQVVPLVDLRSASDAQRIAFRAYRPSRQFYVPPWPGLARDRAFAADFLRPIALHKASIGSSVHVVARMSREAWILLHGCLIRFLARDDGRFAA